MKISFSGRLKERINGFRRESIRTSAFIQELYIEKYDSKVFLKIRPQQNNKYVFKYGKELLVDNFISKELYLSAWDDNEPNLYNIKDDYFIFDIDDFWYMFRNTKDFCFLRTFIRKTPEVLKYLLEDSKVEIFLIPYGIGDTIDCIFVPLDKQKIHAECDVVKAQVVNIDFGPMAIKYIELLRTVDRHIMEDEQFLVWQYRMCNDPSWKPDIEDDY